MRILPALFAIAALISLPDSSRAQPGDERQAWKDRVAEAKWRAERARQNAREEFARRRAEGASVGSDEFEERQARENSEAALNDPDLQSGDIVSTMNGMLMFKGRRGADRTPADFAPYAPTPSR